MSPPLWLTLNKRVAVARCECTLRVCLHQASASMLWQLCDDASHTVLIEINGLTPERGCSLFSSDYIVFNENSITSRVVAGFTLTLGVKGPKALVPFFCNNVIVVDIVIINDDNNNQNKRCTYSLFCKYILFLTLGSANFCAKNFMFEVKLLLDSVLS